jgi:hypothetical protein
MIEFSVPEPSLSDICRRDNGQLRILRESQGVTLCTGFSPQKLFGFRDAARYPLLLCQQDERGWKRPLRQVTLRYWRGQPQFGTVVWNVILKFPLKIGVHDLGCVVGRAFLKARIKLQSVTRNAVF